MRKPPTPTAEQPVVIDLYCRMSFGDDGTIFKCEDQEAEGRRQVEEWARDHRWEFGTEVLIGKVLYDHAKSAWKRGVIRHSFIELMKRLDQGLSHGLWVRDLDRFTRKMDEAVQLKNVATTGRWVLARHSSYDFTTARGIKRFYDDANDAEYESNKISERTREGFMNKAGRGRSNATVRGFGRPGYLPNPKGWEAGDLRYPAPAEQVEREAAAIRDAAKRILAGEPLARIADEWNDDELWTTRGGRWETGILRQMLSRPSIAGLAELKGDILGKLVNVEPILDRETWDRLLLNFAGRKHGRPASVYLLSGILKCDGCGSSIYGRPKNVGRQYWCQKRTGGNGGCGLVSIDQTYADKVVERLVVKRLADPRHTTRVTRVAKAVQGARAELLAELAGLNTDMNALAEKLGEPGWSLERVNNGVAKLGTLAAGVQAKLDELGYVPQVGDPTDDAQADWDESDDDGRRALIRRAYPAGLALEPLAERPGRGNRPKTMPRILPVK